MLINVVHQESVGRPFSVQAAYPPAMSVTPVNPYKIIGAHNQLGYIEFYVRHIITTQFCVWILICMLI